MVQLRFAVSEDKEFWLRLDKYMDSKRFDIKTLCKECYIIEHIGYRVGILRYNLFWDEYPFLNLIYLEQEYRRQGIGEKAITCWEEAMRKAGHRLVLTSTMVEEDAQHFYRKLDYKDCGCLIKEIPPLVETMEIFMMKPL